MNHVPDTYVDEPFKTVTFCSVCGQENPLGDCPGHLPSFREQFNKIFSGPVSVSKELEKILVDNKKEGK